MTENKSGNSSSPESDQVQPEELEAATGAGLFSSATEESLQLAKNSFRFSEGSIPSLVSEEAAELPSISNKSGVWSSETHGPFPSVASSAEAAGGGGGGNWKKWLKPAAAVFTSLGIGGAATYSATKDQEGGTN